MTSGHVLVAGGAGFVGSHVIDRLLERGDSVVCVDNLSSGRAANLAHLAGNDAFRFVEHDVAAPGFASALTGDAFDAVLNLASPASPPDYLARPFDTLDVGSIGTKQLIDLAESCGARFLLASTSEVYGDPLEHPQTETYCGNVNPVGERAVYDEAKRFAEALTAAYQRAGRVDTCIARIFNTYGPRMHPEDGRVVSNFVVQALAGRPLTVYGDGTQTRSFCYVDDEVAGLLALLDSHVTDPVNIGNPGEFTMLELAEIVLELTGSRSPIELLPLPTDDPRVRRPDITRAQTELGWTPTVSLREGLARTIDWFRSLGGDAAAARTTTSTAGAGS